MCNISDQDGFSFSLRGQPQGKRISAEDAERLLLERLKRCERDFLSVLSDLAYFYSTAGRQRQAQAYLERHNAYKNLGVSLAGQGDYANAADNFISATKANAADGRALKLLEQLFVEHPDIKAEMPEIEERIQACRAAVKAVGEFQQQIRRANGPEDRK